MAMNHPGAAARTLALSAALAGLLLTGGAQAQTPPQPAVPTTPNAETPPGGIPRGVIEPRQNRDPEAVITPPPTGGTMPVIPPPGAASGSRVEPK